MGGLAALAAAWVLGWTATGQAAAGSTPPGLSREGPSTTFRFVPAGAQPGPYAGTVAGRERRASGYLVPNPAAYRAAKAAVDRPPKPVADTDPPAFEGAAPIAFKSWKGVYDTTVTPGDTTGAVGPSRYVELINLKFDIYDRTGSTISSGTLATLTGDSGDLTDPQVIWDPDTGRFYYVVLDVSGDVLDVGFSKTNAPSSSTDWCRYTADFGYGSSLPDYPKLGDTKDFLVIGVNVFASTGSFLRSDADWISKPAAGSTCPSGSSFKLGQKQNLLNGDGSKTSTPVPVNQTDTSSSGWIVATKDTTSGPGTFVSVFSVTRNGDGTANIQGQAASVTVSSYSLPPSIPQAGTGATLDSLDGRVTQSVSAVDPGHGSVTTVWLQHTVAGGAGSEVRWYEVNPSTKGIVQSGAATSTSLYVFNGAIAPDRAVNGGSGSFGDTMVIGFDTSSSSTDVAIQMVSKVGSGPQSGFVLVKQSAGPNVDSSCSPCRWGDYAGASPDPVPPAGTHGQVWLTSEWNVSSTNNTNIDWRSQNWGVTP